MEVLEKLLPLLCTTGQGGSNPAATACVGPAKTIRETRNIRSIEAEGGDAVGAWEQRHDAWLLRVAIGGSPSLEVALARAREFQPVVPAGDPPTEAPTYRYNIHAHAPLCRKPCPLEPCPHGV